MHLFCVHMAYVEVWKIFRTKNKSNLIDFLHKIGSSFLLLQNMTLTKYDPSVWNFPATIENI